MYGDGKGLVMRGHRIIGTLEQTGQDVTVEPFETSNISTELCDRMYEVVARALGKNPKDVAEQEVIAFLGLVDERIRKWPTNTEKE